MTGISKTVNTVLEELSAIYLTHLSGNSSSVSHLEELYMKQQACLSVN